MNESIYDFSTSDLKKIVEKEHQIIYEKWLYRHFRITAIIVLVVFIMEIIFGKVMYDIGNITVSLSRYVMKFLVLPSFLNFLLIFIQYRVITSKKLSLDIKIYAISLLFVAISFIVYTVHSGLSALYYFFMAPIVLTIIYGKYKVTLYTFIASLCSFIISEVFIQWDVDKVTIYEAPLVFSNFILAIVILISFFVICIRIIYFEKEKTNASLKKEMEIYHLRQEVRIDKLTQTLNRMALRASIDELVKNASENTYFFAMVDIDNFKFLNDTFGHMAGDDCLVKLSQIMQKYCGSWYVFRFGGDEFSIIFKNKTQSEIIGLCKTIQKDFTSATSQYHKDRRTSLSIGIAEYDGICSPSDLIAQADAALYESKKQKNCISVYSE